jgi:hypothetical protein
MTSSPRGRVERLVDAARRVADPRDSVGRRARSALRSTTGLSAEGIELGFAHLETTPSTHEVEALCASVSPTDHAHVLLSANVFIAAHRAIAVALAASERVRVRPSRRDPVLAELLCELTGAFELVPELRPEAASHVWAYGTDETLRDVRASLPPDVVLHAHGAGIGIAVVEPDTEGAAAALARDVAVFDQRGCLSPRIAFFAGARDEATDFARALARELDALEQRVPLGELDDEERAAVARYRDTAVFAGDVFQAGRGLVSVDDGEAPLIPPVGRNVRVAGCADPVEPLARLARAVTTVGTACSPSLVRALESAVPGARFTTLGAMQRPPFDGPVDRRTDQ